jgi:hypothetical protein
MHQFEVLVKATSHLPLPLLYLVLKGTLTYPLQSTKTRVISRNIVLMLVKLPSKYFISALLPLLTEVLNLRVSLANIMQEKWPCTCACTGPGT